MYCHEGGCVWMVGWLGGIRCRVYVVRGLHLLGQVGTVELEEHVMLDEQRVVGGRMGCGVREGG